MELKTRLHRAISSRPSAGSLYQTGASRLNEGASRPDKNLALGEQNIRPRPNENPPAVVNKTGASRLTEGALRPDKKLAYVEVHVRPSADQLYCTGALRPGMKTRLRRAI